MSDSAKPTWGERMTNPVIKSVLKHEKTQEATNVVTYKSVFLKTGLFLLMFLLGVAGAFVLHAFTQQIPIEGLSEFSVSYTEIVVFCVALLVSIICSIVASLSIRMAGVFGTISCIAYGYTLGFMATTIPSYQGPILLALVITVVVITGLILLYRTNIIKVTKKFRTVTATLFWSMILGSLILFVLSFVPATSASVAWLYNNPVLSILFGVIGVIIVSMFLLCDFDSIKTAVENQTDKKYENMLAFGLAFSVIWLYFKILQLILSIMQNSNN